MYDGVERLESGLASWRGDTRSSRSRVGGGAVLDTISQGYLVFDGWMRVVLSNPQAGRLLGLRHHADRTSLAQLLRDADTLDASAQLALSQAAQAARCGTPATDVQRIGGLEVSIRPLSREAGAGAVSTAGAGDGAFWLVSLRAV